MRTHSRILARTLANKDGAAAIEAAFVLPIFLTMVIGFFKLSMILWTISSLHYAVESAARCAAVNKTTCGNAAAIQTYALNRYFGAPLPSNPFTYAATACGHSVTAAYNYPLAIPFVSTSSVALSTAACFP